MGTIFTLPLRHNTWVYVEDPKHLGALGSAPWVVERGCSRTETYTEVPC